MADSRSSIAASEAPADSSAGASAQEGRTPTEPCFTDFLFHQRRKHGKYRVIDGPDPALEGPVADTHCHLAPLGFRAASMARAAAWGVDFACDVCDPAEDAAETFARLSSWEAEARAWAAAVDDAPAAPAAPVRYRLAVGVHPHNASYWGAGTESELKRYLADSRTAAVGEVGLDYYYDLSPREAQRAVFRAQIRIAHETGLPLALHIRDAHAEALAILDEEGFPEAGTILHCCSLPPAELEPWIDRGCFIAYGGAVTFKKLDDARAGARLVPADRLLTETDCPYMTPEPLRGIENGSEYIVFTAAMLAEVRGARPGEDRRRFLAQLHANATGLLDRKPTAWQLSAR